MDLAIYNIIKGPRITEKAYQLNQKLKQLVIEVHPHANKIMIAQALKRLFNVEVEEIRIVIRKGKNKRVGRYKTQNSDMKKAIVSLKKGYSVDLMGLSNSASQDQEKAPIATENK